MHDIMYKELITPIQRRAVAWIIEFQADGQLFLLRCLLINGEAQLRLPLALLP